MSIRIYWVHEFESGSKLGIMARPRGGDWLEDEIRGLARQGVGMLVSLLEGHEIDELDLNEEHEICEHNAVTFINFPIPDRSIPRPTGGVDLVVDKILESLGSGKSTVVHCRMGIGRSTIMAASVLQRQGRKSSELLTHISKARGLKVPDTDEQVGWLNHRDK